MKRPLSVILLLLLTIMSFTSCLEKPETIELENQVSQELTQEYNQLLDFTQNASELKEVEKYILDWADANSFKAYHDKNGNISISKDAYGDYENEPSTIVQCTLTLENPEIYVKSMATALYILKNAESHGRISVLFTSNEDGSHWRASRSRLRASGNIPNSINILLIFIRGFTYRKSSCIAFV